MPNHVVSKITADKEILDRLVGINEKGEEFVDFNRIIPQPALIRESNNFGVSMHVESSAKRALGLIDPSEMKELPKDFGEDDFSMFIVYQMAWRKHGCMNWYQWNKENWGTKWNAYSFERIGDTEITFKTAWAAPHPVIEKLAEHGDVIHQWADEDTGRNVGYAKYTDGNYKDYVSLDGTREGYELAFELHPGVEEFFELVNGKYVYKEEDDDDNVP